MLVLLEKIDTFGSKPELTAGLSRGITGGKHTLHWNFANEDDSLKVCGANMEVTIE